MSSIDATEREILETIGFDANLCETIIEADKRVSRGGSACLVRYFSIPSRLRETVWRLNYIQLRDAMAAVASNFRNVRVHAEVLNMPNFKFNGCYSISVVIG
jgi:hypothetical protein